MKLTTISLEGELAHADGETNGLSVLLAFICQISKIGCNICTAAQSHKVLLYRLIFNRFDRQHTYSSLSVMGEFVAVFR